MDKQKLWNETLGVIKVSVSQATFSTWFAQTFIAEEKVFGKRRTSIVIACPSSYAADAIEKRYFGLVQDALAQITARKADISFIVRPPEQKTTAVSAPLFANEPETNNLERLLQKARLRPGFTFANFAVSATNQMAHAAAEAVCQNLGKAYNPLFLWGGVGVGKTHLMLAIGHKVLGKTCDLAILYCTGEEFTTGIVEAIRTKTTAQFKNKYRKLSLLLVDDVHFLAGKNAVQEEFFHTFNILQREGGQIVLTSDRPPEEIQDLEARLKSRFEAGLCIDIAPPDFELRAAIALIKARERGLQLSSGSAQAIAANLNSTRRIEGFITRLTAESAGKEENLGEVVTRILTKTNGDVTPTGRARLPQEVIDVVANHFSLGKRKLLGGNRSRPIVVPRQILMYLLRVELGLPYEEVGRLVGGRDHTTAIHAVEKISKNIAHDLRLQEDVLGIKRTLSG